MEHAASQPQTGRASRAQRAVSSEKTGSKVDTGELSRKGNLKSFIGDLVDAPRQAVLFFSGSILTVCYG